MIKNIVLFIVLANLMSCSLLQKIKRDDTQSKTLNVKNIWTQNLLNFENKTFRKINRFSPILYKDLIVVGNSFEGLSAYDIYAQKKVWTLEIPLGVESSGVLLDDTLYVGGLNGIFYAVDLKSQKIEWQFDTKSEIVAEPVIFKDTVFFQSGSNILYALNRGDGRQKWVYNRQETSGQMTIRGGSRPLIHNEKVYVGFSDGSLVCINLQTGSPQWEVLLNRNTKFKDIDASPVIDGSTLYMNSYDDKLYAIDQDTGTILWSAPYGGFSTPLIYGELIISGSSKGEIVALNKNKGQVVWKKSNINGIATDPIIHKGLLVVGESQGPVVFYDALNGQIENKFDPGKGTLTRIVSDKNKRVYFVSGEANLYALQIEWDNYRYNFPYLNNSYL